MGLSQFIQTDKVGLWSFNIFRPAAPPHFKSRRTLVVRPFKGKVDCLAPGDYGFRAPFQCETNGSADKAKPGQDRRGL